MKDPQFRQTQMIEQSLNLEKIESKVGPFTKKYEIQFDEVSVIAF